VARSDFQELIDRSKYMERILIRTIEGVRLDTKSLARLADTLDADSRSVCGVTSDSQEVEGLVMDDEACTMEPVGDNTTRESPRPTFHATKLLIFSRFFGRIFILELLHAIKAAY
jgi:hypothetical protein